MSLPGASVYYLWSIPQLCSEPGDTNRTWQLGCMEGTELASQEAKPAGISRGENIKEIKSFAE